LFTGSKETARCRISLVLLLNLTSSLVADEEVYASGDGSNGDYTDNDACGDASFACSSTRL
jgi:hypothetical protein